MEAVGKKRHLQPAMNQACCFGVSDWHSDGYCAQHMLARIESEDLDLVFTAVNIQREVGGNLAEILETISHTIRERIRSRVRSGPDGIWSCQW